MQLPFMGKLPHLEPDVYVAEGAKIVGDVTIGEKSTVWFNAVLRGDLAPIVIGKHCNIQDGVVGHVNTNQPLLIGDGVSIGHAAIIHGCKIGKGTLIGMGAIVLNGADIGEYALVGAGALVTENQVIPPHSLCLGSPAKIVRLLNEQDLQRMKNTADSYVSKGVQYRNP